MSYAFWHGILFGRSSYNTESSTPSKCLLLSSHRNICQCLWQRKSPFCRKDGAIWTVIILISLFWPDISHVMFRQFIGLHLIFCFAVVRSQFSFSHCFRVITKSDLLFSQVTIIFLYLLVCSSCHTAFIFSFPQSLFYNLFSMCPPLSFVDFFICSNLSGSTTFVISREGLLYVGWESRCLWCKRCHEEDGREALGRRSELNESQFLTSHYLVLCELGTSSIILVLLAFLATFDYALKDVWMRVLVFQMFCGRGYRVSLFNGARFLRTVIDVISGGKAQTPYEMSVPTAFEAQFYFYALDILS